MSKTEYVGVSAGEKVQGEKNLLNARLELLNMMKSFQAYRLLRKEEILLKISLKMKIAEALELVEKFEKCLPKSNFRLPDEEDIKKREKKNKEHLELQNEIELVRRKLEELKRGI